MLAEAARERIESSKNGASRVEIPEPPDGRTLRSAHPEVKEMDDYLNRLCMLLRRAIERNRTTAVRSYRRAIASAMLRMEDAASRAVHAHKWDASLVGNMMLEIEGSVGQPDDRCRSSLEPECQQRQRPMGKP